MCHPEITDWIPDLQDSSSPLVNNWVDVFAGLKDRLVEFLRGWESTNLNPECRAEEYLRVEKSTDL